MSRSENSLFVCAAYPSGIPAKFLSGKSLHLKPWRQKNKIIFEPADGVRCSDIEYFIEDEKILDRYFPLPSSIRVFAPIVGTFAVGKKQIENAKKGDEIFLEREPANKFDKNAIKVYDRQRRPLGYVPREIAAKIAKCIDKGERISNSYILETRNLYNEKEIFVGFELTIKKAKSSARELLEEVERAKEEWKKQSEINESNSDWIELEEQKEREKNYIINVRVDSEFDRDRDIKKVSGSVIEVAYAPIRTFKNKKVGKGRYLFAEIEMRLKTLVYQYKIMTRKPKDTGRF